MVPLFLIRPGEIVKVEDVKGGEIVCRRLMEMGFNRGTTIKIIRNSEGPLIVGIGEGRIVIGRGMAAKVMVGNDYN